MIVVSQRAAERYRERVNPAATLADARAAIRAHAAAIEKAAEFRCPTVILGNGARLQLDGACVVTVLPAIRRRGRLA